MTVPSSHATRRMWKFGAYGVGAYLLVSAFLLGSEYMQHGFSTLVMLHFFFLFSLLLLLIPLYQLAYRNNITGLRNRNRLVYDLEQPQPGYLAALNIRGFHLINDAYGIRAGDRVLKEIANDLRAITAPDTKIYHSEADVFAFIFTADDPYSYLKKIQRIITEKRRQIDHQTLHLRIEIGYAPLAYPHPLRYAMRGIYVARKRKMFVAEGTPDDTHSLTRSKMHLIDEVFAALKEDRIEAWYMPIQDVRKKKIVAYEALARIRTAKGELIPPEEFITTAAEHGILSEITVHILDQALQAFTNRPEEVSINISHLDLESPLHLRKILERLRGFGAPERITFEITETSLFLNRDLAETGLKDILHSGARLSIDDFGIGYSNFARIVEMQIHEIKLDGSLIAPLVRLDSISDEELLNKKRVTQSIISLAKKMDLVTCAEFVETEEHIKLCHDLGVDRMQGYAIGAPQPLPLPEPESA